MPGLTTVALVVIAAAAATAVGPGSAAAALPASVQHYRARSRAAVAAAVARGAARRRQGLPPPAAALVRNCSQLMDAADDVTNDAQLRTRGQTQYTITLACGASFDDCDAARSIVLAGRGRVTLSAEPACAQGAARPRLGARPAGGGAPATEFLNANGYVPPAAAPAMALALRGVVFDCGGLRPGLVLGYMSGVTLEDVDVLGCTQPTFDGGAIKADNSPLSIKGGRIAGNSARTGGAVAAFCDDIISPLDVSGALILNNTALGGDADDTSGLGGAFWFEKRRPGAFGVACSGCTVAGNAAASGCGVLAFARQDSRPRNQRASAAPKVDLRGSALGGNTAPDGTILCGSAFSSSFRHSRVTPLPPPGGLSDGGAAGNGTLAARWNDFLWVAVPGGGST